MLTNAVSIEDLISKKHELKWKDYYLLKSIICNAYMSNTLEFSQKIDSVRLSVLKCSYFKGKHLYIHHGYSRHEESYVVSCYIK